MKQFFITIVFAMSTFGLMAQEIESTNFLSKLNFQVNVHGNADSDDLAHGVGVRAWYFPADNWGIGPEASYDVYNRFFEEKLVNMGGNGIYLFNNLGIFQPFASIGVGYAQPHFGFENIQDIGLNQKSGGVYVHPQVGAVIHATDGFGISIGIGYFENDTSFSTSDVWGNGSDTSITYKRYSFTLGFVF